MEKKAKMFNGRACEVWETGDDRVFFITTKELARALNVERNTVQTYLSQMPQEIRDGMEKGVEKLDTPGGTQNFRVIYASGVVKLLSRIPCRAGIEFRSWVASIAVEHMGGCLGSEDMMHFTHQKAKDTNEYHMKQVSEVEKKIKECAKKSDLNELKNLLRFHHQEIEKNKHQYSADMNHLHNMIKAQTPPTHQPGIPILRAVNN